MRNAPHRRTHSLLIPIDTHTPRGVALRATPFFFRKILLLERYLKSWTPSYTTYRFNLWIALLQNSKAVGLVPPPIIIIEAINQ